MKSKFLLIAFSFLMLCCTFPVSAQSNKTGMYWGPKGALNFTKFEDIASGRNVGYDIGLVLGADIKIIGFEAGLMYSNERSGDLITNNISVPIIAKLFLIDGFHVFAGPRLDFLLKEKYRTPEGILSPYNNTIQTVSVSGVVGAGYQFLGGISAGLTYNVGPIRTKDGVDNMSSFVGSGDLTKVQKHNVAIFLGYRF